VANIVTIETERLRPFEAADLDALTCLHRGRVVLAVPPAPGDDL
jgi:hypothetical protein